jgi:hypothetical protein
MKQHLIRLSLCIAVLLPVAPLARGQQAATPEDKRLEAIEKQLQSLQESLKELRGARAATSQPASQAAATQPASQPANDPISRIRDEGLNRSQVMQTLSYLTDVIGPRLTGSPNLRRANEWTRERLSSWGLVNARLEPWGPFGRGWSLKRFSAQIVEPQAIPLIGAPKAWTPGFDRPVTGEVIHFDVRTEGDLAKYKGKLRGAVVLYGPAREVPARFEAPGVRMTDENLLQLANSGSEQRAPVGLARSLNPAERRGLFAEGRLAGVRRSGTTFPTTGPTSAPTTGPGRPVSPGRVLGFLLREGVAVVVTPSMQGDGGTYFVGSAGVPDVEPQPPTATRPTTEPTTMPTTSPARPQAIDCPPMPAQITLAIEDYNRLVRMIQQGEKPKMEVDLRVQYHTADLMAYNTVAEIPGTDLADQIVMLGAHMDSWHSGTGATDNGAGCAAVMEAVRIIRASGLKPRRTIRIALWTGEEEGLLGSKAYVAKYFGSFEGDEQPGGATTRPTTRRSGRFATSGPTSRPARQLVRQPQYDKLCAYFNLDNGTGKIRGVYMQGNEAVRPTFRQWLVPFADLGASTLSLSGTGGTDHLSFDAIGLPGFQFIQDPVEYWSRTHHSNQDVYDRAQAEDMKQAATIIAAFVYNAATTDEMLPRKDTPGAPGRRGGPVNIASGRSAEGAGTARTASATRPASRTNTDRGP